jgi:hypothetical protein
MGNKMTDTEKTLKEFIEKFQTFETFVTRRFDEISMEVNATSQQMDFAEDSLGKRFSEMSEVIQNIAFDGDGKTPANLGVELSAVIEVTENSANTIMDSAELIKNLMIKIGNEAPDDRFKATIKAIQKELLNIYMACEFQDITSQRINKAVEDLNDVELKIANTLDQLGIEKPKPKAPMDMMSQVSSQADIDKLFD